ncbi:MAG TPA: hypothetical protein VH298_02370 [Jatrophihabitans sp.]|jgi:hypothetical protein|nr:hypothetical protein [Jatrophihabitans sp.]
MPGVDSSLVVPGSTIAGNFDQIRALADELTALAAEFGETPSIVHRMNNMTGTPLELAAALERAERDWVGHRRALQAFLDETARSVERAVAGYRAVEQDIVRAGRPVR